MMHYVVFTGAMKPNTTERHTMKTKITEAFAVENDIRVYVSHNVNADNFYSSINQWPPVPIQLPTDFQSDLSIDGLGEAAEIEIEQFTGLEAGHFSGVVTLKATTATQDALKKLNSLWWVGYLKVDDVWMAF